MSAAANERWRRQRQAAKLRRANSLFVPKGGLGEAANLAESSGTSLPAATDWRADVYARGLNTEQSHQAPRKSDQDRILAIQGNVCLYCGIPIGAVIGRAVKKPRGYVWRTTVVLRRNWDHFVPYAYVARNPGANWVLACHVCNRAKGARMFATVEEARRAILPVREEKGYESVRSVLTRYASPAKGVPAKGPQKGSPAVDRSVLENAMASQLSDSLNPRKP